MTSPPAERVAASAGAAQPLVEPHLARRGVVVLDQGPGVVEQDLLRNPAELAERRLHAGEPANCRSWRKARTNTRRE